MAALDLNTVRQTIEARLATEMASSPAITTIFANEPFTSLDAVPTLLKQETGTTLK